jgi:hypothetical protein
LLKVPKKSFAPKLFLKTSALKVMPARSARSVTSSRSPFLKSKRSSMSPTTTNRELGKRRVSGMTSSAISDSLQTMSSRRSSVRRARFSA